MVCRKFQFQVFNYLDENGKGTLKEEEAVQCTRATAFLVADHLSQLLINDGMSREGALMPLCHAHTLLYPCFPRGCFLLGTEITLTIPSSLACYYVRCKLRARLVTLTS